MNTYEGSRAVSKARVVIIVFAIILLLLGVVAIIIGFEELELLSSGALLLGAGVSLLIFSALIKGFERIVRASEKFLEINEQKSGDSSVMVNGDKTVYKEHSIEEALRCMDEISKKNKNNV